MSAGAPATPPLSYTPFKQSASTATPSPLAVTISSTKSNKDNSDNDNSNDNNKGNNNITITGRANDLLPKWGGFNNQLLGIRR